VLTATVLVTGLLLVPVLAGADPSRATPPQDEPETEIATATVDTAETAPPSTQQTEAARLAEQWGIEVASIRLTAHNHMIDFRYRVLDSAKAAELFVRQNKPALIHQETGRVLAVPETAKVGPLRNSNQPQQGKIYWMFFGNAGGLVKPGDEVTVVIGEFRVEDLVVE
jgi:hypothetical protein